MEELSHSGITDMPSNLADLQQALERLRMLPFPRGITDDRVDELRSDLADFDGYVHGLLRQVLAGQKSLSHPLERDPVLRDALERIRDAGHEPAKAEAIQLLVYLDSLEEAIAIARKHLPGDATALPST
jgi:type II secretory pathway predicted ATPase ExeA